MMGNIFNKYYLHDYINNYRERLTEEIDKLEITESTNIPNTVNRLISKYTIKPIILGEPTGSEPKESKREIREFGDRVFQQEVFEIGITIPFTGEKDLFDCIPSRSSILYMDKSFHIGHNSISAKIVLENLDSAVYKRQVDKIIDDLTKNIPTINQEISPWNNGLYNLIDESLAKRKGIVSKKHDFMKEIGLTVNPTSDTYMIPPPIAKKAIPAPVADTSKEVKREAIPTLQDEVYRDIKEVLYNVGRAIEKKPSIYKDKHEEDLRDIFLLFLETRYESTTGTGEAFNKSGKTDILLKYAKDGSNIFVAECKFWKGKAKLTEAIDQLLGYLTHRDSKTSLIFFVDQKDFTSVIDTLKSEISNHKFFKRIIGTTYDSSISYEFLLPDDPQISIQIEVMLFHFPK